MESPSWFLMPESPFKVKSWGHQLAFWWHQTQCMPVRLWKLLIFFWHLSHLLPSQPPLTQTCACTYRREVRNNEIWREREREISRTAIPKLQVLPSWHSLKGRSKTLKWRQRKEWELEYLGSWHSHLPFADNLVKGKNTVSSQKQELKFQSLIKVLRIRQQHGWATGRQI